ncbi:MAG: flagellar hook protein FlgE [Burkholderiales bacterium]|nr:flagellar hook protein FlgE [Burkholderiales bacterium]
MSFQQGLSGLNAAAKNLDVIGNNIANASTVGFKGSESRFADVFASSNGNGAASVGIGTSVSAIIQDFGQGTIEVTSNPLDVAINGQGFFRMSYNGAVTYTRNGQFQLDSQGYIVDADSKNLTGYPPAAGGGVTTASPVNLQISNADLPPLATAQAIVGTTLDSRSNALPSAGFNLTDSATYHGATSLSVYDSLGNSHTLSLYYVKTAANSWDVFAANNNVQVGAGAVGTMTFNSNGTVASAPPLALTLPVTTGAAPIAVTVDVAQSTQFGSPFGVTRVQQDGYGAGRLTGFSISGDGLITGRYSNGQSRAQGQIALTNFTNTQGLKQLGSNQWGETAASGPPLTGAPGSGNLGVLNSGSVENANVDLTAELVDLITAQRVYQANAQTIKTQDQVLQTLVNMR